MKGKNSSLITMFLIVDLFLEENKEIYKLLVPLVTKVALFHGKVLDIKAALKLLGIDPKAKTKSKEQLKAEMIDLMFDLSLLAYVWAHDKNKAELMVLFEKSKDNFIIEEKLLVALIENLLFAIEDNQTGLTVYGITEESTAAAQLALAAFVEAKDLPKKNREENKVLNAQLSLDVKEAESILGLTDNLIIGNYKRTNNDFVKEYLSHRVADNPVSRHTTLNVHVFNDDEHQHPNSNAEISIEKLHRSEHTNIDGFASIVQFKGGDYLLDIKAVGRVNKQVPFSIVKGKHLDLDVVLVPNQIEAHLTENSLPVSNLSVSVVDTSIVSSTNDKGIANLFEVPDGDGMLEISDEYGNIVTAPYHLVNGKKLRIDIVWHK